ncbi:MAG TPA: hypothetical protein PKV71_11360 [Calditrichia bacterium]|nr:hypothetical protein [Calditrichota bacterium]HQV32469.1 hypothetical protein [Calditrichia bacterium]
MPIKFKDWQLDRWFSTSGTVLPYDKPEHFLLAIILAAALFFLLRRKSLWISVLIFSLLAIGWEIRDGLVPYRDQLVEGFSWKDLIADYAGLGVALLGKAFFQNLRTKR